MKLHEFSPPTLAGSFTPDLVASKQWLIDKLMDISPQLGRIYILGSWYGNLSLLMADSSIRYKEIINVDTDSKAVRQGERLARNHNSIHAVVQDANEIKYRNPSIVINTSCNDMPNHGWFDHIPGGILVAAQTRGKPFDFDLSQVLYKGKRQLADPQGEYTRFMIIGLK